MGAIKGDNRSLDCGSSQTTLGDFFMLGDGVFIITERTLIAMHCTAQLRRYLKKNSVAQGFHHERLPFACVVARQICFGFDFNCTNIGN